MPGVEPESQRAAPATDAGNPGHGQRLKKRDKPASKIIKQLIHELAETDFSDAILKVIGAVEDLNFHAHKVNGKIAAIDLGEAHRILLRGDDKFRLAFLATIDGVEDFLLGKTVMIGKTFRVNEAAAKAGEALFETFGLGNAA